MPPLFDMLGIAGIAIAMLAYLPQVVHLSKERCSDGISRRAWAMWLLSSLLIGALALHRRDPVFILLQISNLMSTAIVLSLSWRYRGMVCEAHALRSYPLNHNDWPLPSRASGGIRSPSVKR
jgi:lipid-A-disaccharide synthase-like uncharacterized protein